ncbi:IclR family transcriptional regulator [Marinomonas sp. IMCC 4694]|uniref:IclR family transcriptional regulator n=1 Tax=Marinomonas sp. IMCC 4694 TaxID=2605432 RepID=UPI0011E633D5|nr:IclR family transcriptional regulator [Marinomonas sp. IMCC 4694]TYL46918.1 IclR family transcriptional regulator [Marinomonas sp. IMCC 4694]
MSDIEKMKQDNARQGIGSLEIGLRILNLITQSPKPPTLKILSEQLSHSPSRLHKYLVSLLRMEYITQINGSQYALGKASLTLGIAAIKKIDPIRQALDAVDSLSQETDKTVSVTIWNGRAPLVIKWLDASQPIAVNVRLGSELSPFFSVSGRIFLANLPLARRKILVSDFFENLPAAPRYQGKSMNQEAFNAHLELIKADNLCAFSGDFLPDINVIGSAIYDINGNVSSVVTLMGMANDCSTKKDSWYPSLVKKYANQVTDVICGSRSPSSAL